MLVRQYFNYEIKQNLVFRKSIGILHEACKNLGIGLVISIS